MGAHYTGIYGSVSRNESRVLPWVWEVTRADGQRIAWGEASRQSMAFEVCEVATSAARAWWSIGRRSPWARSWIV